MQPGPLSDPAIEAIFDIANEGTNSSPEILQLLEARGLIEPITKQIASGHRCARLTPEGVLEALASARKSKTTAPPTSATKDLNLAQIDKSAGGAFASAAGQAQDMAYDMYIRGLKDACMVMCSQCSQGFSLVRQDEGSELLFHIIPGGLMRLCRASNIYTLRSRMNEFNIEAQGPAE